MGDETLPVVTPPSLADVDLTSSVHGVVLAAGTSSRYGSANKLLQPLAGDPLVVHAVSSLVAAPVDGVTVVVGHDAARVRSALATQPVDVRLNDAFDAGQRTSVREGTLSARDADADAVIIALGDMPAIDTATITALIAAYERGDGSALAAGYNGRRGNPVLFDATHFGDLASGTGDVGGKHVLQNAATAAIVETGDPGVLYDIDRTADRNQFDTD